MPTTDSNYAVKTERDRHVREVALGHAVVLFGETATSYGISDVVDCAKTFEKYLNGER